MDKMDDLYKRLRSKVEHEDELVHQRLTWMITLHGLLFTAYGFSLSAEATSLSSLGILSSSAPEHRAAYLAFSKTITDLRQAMVFVGIVSSLAALIGVVAAFRAIRDDAALLIPFRKRHHDSTYPELIGRPAINTLGMISGIVIPFLAGGVWTWIGGFIPNPILLGVGIIAASIIAFAMWPLIPIGERKEERKRARRAKVAGEGKAPKEIMANIKPPDSEKDKATEQNDIQGKEK